MAENNFYGYVDDGNIKLTHGCCSHSCNSDLKAKVNNILEGAPESMDSFKEVYDEFKKLNGSFNDADSKFGDVDSKFGDMNTSFGQLQENLENLSKTVEEMKKCHCHHDHHFHGDHLHKPFPPEGCYYDDGVSHVLNDMRFDMDCEYSKRVHDINKLEEIVKRLEINVKHLDLLRVTKLENIVQGLVNDERYKFDLETIMKRFDRIERKIQNLEEDIEKKD